MLINRKRLKQAWGIAAVTLSLIAGGVMFQNCGNIIQKTPTSGLTIQTATGYQSSQSLQAMTIDLSNTYDSSPSAFREDNGNIKVYTCTGEGGHDTIHLSEFDATGQVVRASRKVIDYNKAVPGSDDGRHACAPTVVKHRHAALFGGAPAYKMYYECEARTVNGQTGTEVAGPAQICHAVSDDGITWRKWDERSRQYVPADSQQPIEALIKMSDPVRGNCGASHSGDRAIIQNPGNCDLGNNYGSGHPSAIVKEAGDGQLIQLYYYDSKGNYAHRRVRRALSWDGFNFTEFQDTNLTQPMNIYFLPAANGGNGVYLGVAAMEGANAYGFSTDGLHFEFPDTLEKIQRYSFAKRNAGLCPLSPALVSDPEGKVTGNTLQIFSQEGKLGTFDRGQQLNCFDAREDSSRGVTWAVYYLEAPIPREIPGASCRMVCTPGVFGGYKCTNSDRSCPVGMNLNPQGTNCRPSSASATDQWIWDSPEGCGAPRRIEVEPAQSCDIKGGAGTQIILESFTFEECRSRCDGLTDRPTRTCSWNGTYLAGYEPRPRTCDIRGGAGTQIALENLTFQECRNRCDSLTDRPTRTCSWAGTYLTGYERKPRLCDIRGGAGWQLLSQELHFEDCRAECSRFTENPNRSCTWGPSLLCNNGNCR